MSCNATIEFNVTQPQATIEFNTSMPASIDVSVPPPINTVEVNTPLVQPELVHVQPASVAFQADLTPIPIQGTSVRDYAFSTRGRLPSFGVLALCMGELATTSVPLVLERRVQLVGATFRLDTHDPQSYQLSIETRAGAVLATLDMPATNQGDTLYVSKDDFNVVINAGVELVIWVKRISGTARSRWRRVRATLAFREV